MADGHAVIRCDASAEMGGGHAVRCLALADALVQAGWRATFAGRRETVETVPAIARSGHGWWELSGAAESEPSMLRARALEGCDALIVDHYARGADFESSLRGWAARIVAIEDMPSRPHDCDVLLDPTPGRKSKNYSALLPARCELLLGPHYALLRSQFAAARRVSLRRRAKPHKPARLFVNLGATDPANLTAVVLDGIAASGLSLSVDVAIGSGAPHLSAVRERAKAVGADLHVDADDMASLMADADLAVGAAGSSSFERCCMGLPSLIVIAADNQRQIAAALTEAGAAASLGEASGLRSERIAAALRKVSADERELTELSRRATALCDGRGAARAVMTLAPGRATDGKDVRLRPATFGDSAVMLEWQRHPTTRRYARNTAIPGEAEHRAWLEQRLADPATLLNLVLHGGKAAGVLRLDAVGDTAESVYEVSILVDPERRGRGLGRAALALAARLVPESALYAEVHPENAASQSLFRSAGFRRAGAGYRREPLSQELRH